MHTLAQNSFDEVGYSKLGELLNQGVDPHAYFAGAARCGGLSAAQVLERPDAKELRDWAKPNNFGRAGGMGNASFVLFSRKQYGVLFTLDEAEHYGKIWFSLFPEVKDLHRHVQRLLGRKETCTVRIKRGGFVAGGKRFPAACNFFFQAPCAAGAKASLCHVAYECYSDPNSPLFGFRVWNMVHDELCLEGPTDRIHDAGARLRVIMEREFDFYTPNYPTGVEVIAGNAWSKKAKRTLDRDGRLIPWQYAEN
jgi:DNA polymerase I-like protein with 3'-5' exonuclease and polymerase domains